MGRYYPVMLDLAGVECLVVGGGRVAERKVEGLLNVGARVTVIAPRATERLAELARQGKVQHERRPFAAGDAAGHRLVIAATDDARLNAEVAGEGRRRGILVNVVDCAPESNFIVPATVRRGELVISVSTGGASPAQARRIRERLEGEFGPEWGPYLGLLEELRPQVSAVLPPGAARETVFQRLAVGPVRETLAQGEAEAARAAVSRALGEAATGLEGFVAAAVDRALAALKTACQAAAEPVKVKVGTRESKLALWQTEWVVGQLAQAHPGRPFEYVHIRTKGDKILDSPLAAIGDRGLFVKEIEEALLGGEVDLAVHSLKDVPTEVRAGLTLAAVTRRADPRDCLLSRRHASFTALPPGARLGTSSLRRVAQLKAARPDLEFVSLRGNLDTRLRKLDELDLDGIVLAAAGLERLGWTELVVERLSPDLCLPAVGQGALAIETRADDAGTVALVKVLDDPVTTACVWAERALLEVLEGGCQVPIGALALPEGDGVWLRGAVASLDGRKLVRGERRGRRDEAEALGRELGQELLARGGREILQEIRAGGSGE